MHVWYMLHVPRVVGFGCHAGCDVLFWPCRIALIAKNGLLINDDDEMGTSEERRGGRVRKGEEDDEI